MRFHWSLPATRVAGKRHGAGPKGDALLAMSGRPALVR
jgi:hypothetical protein